MDHSPEEERDCGNKPTEANLTAVKGAPSVHQPLSTNDGGGGEIQYILLIKRSQIHKLTSKSNVDELKEAAQVIQGEQIGRESVCFLLLFRVNEDSAQ